MKKRIPDLIKSSHIHSLAAIGLIVLLLFIFGFKSIPKIFAENDNFSNKKMSSLSLNADQEKFLINKMINMRSLQNERGETGDTYFKNLDIVAKSYIVYDVANKKVISARNENEVLPLASLTKVVTAATAIHKANENTNITIDRSLMREDEGFDPGLSQGQVWKLGDLLRYGLTISSNSSMDIIAGTLSKTNEDFVKEMSTYLQTLGFKYFTFNSASGLDYGEVIGGQGTALEYAKFFAKAYELIPEILSYTINSKLNLSGSQNLYQIPNTNKDASRTIGLMASKTGFTDAAGGNLAVMINYRISRPIVIVVLGSTTDDRFKDVAKLYSATIQTLD